MLRLPIVVVLVALSASLTACNRDERFKPVHPVRGQVLFEGKPVAGGTISFFATGGEEHPWTKPSAEIDEQGNFVVSTYRANDGMPVGEYAVTVVWLPKGYAGPPEKGNKLPMRYADKSSSGISVEVREGDNVLPTITLTK